MENILINYLIELKGYFQLAIAFIIMALVSFLLNHKEKDKLQTKSKSWIHLNNK